MKEAKYNLQLENINGKLLEDYELNYNEALELWIEIEDLDYTKTKVKKTKERNKRFRNCRFVVHRRA